MAYLSAFIALIPVFSALFYHIYLLDHLTNAEQVLLPLKTRVYGYISTISLSIIALAFLIVLSAFSYAISFNQFLICVLMTINIILLFILMGFMSFYHPIDTFLIIGKSKFKLLNRIDSNHISVRPQWFNDKETMLINILSLENYTLREEYRKTKPKSENWIISILFGIIASISGLIIIMAFNFPESSCAKFWICFGIGVIAAGIMYSKKINQK